MSIKVKVNDGAVEVGGSFEKALGFVKAQAGRKYDPATKTWTVPLSYKEFRAQAAAYGLPLDNGAEHVTRYGNRYSRDEWAAQQAADKAASEAGREMMPAVDAAKAAYMRQVMDALSVLGDEVARKLYDLFMRPNARAGHLSLDEAERMGLIKFSSPARREAVAAAVKAARAVDYSPVLKAEEAVEDAEERARQEVFQAYGAW